MTTTSPTEITHGDISTDSDTDDWESSEEEGMNDEDVETGGRSYVQETMHITRKRVKIATAPGQRGFSNMRERYSIKAC